MSTTPSRTSSVVADAIRTALQLENATLKKRNKDLAAKLQAANREIRKLNAAKKELEKELEETKHELENTS